MKLFLVWCMLLALVLGKNSADNIKNVIELNALKDGNTLREDAVLVSRNNISFPKNQEFVKALRSKHRLLTDIPLDSIEDELLDSLKRTLNFYAFQLDDIMDGDTAFSLQALKVIDDKHGKILQKEFPLDQWIQSICDRAIVSNPDKEKSCMSSVRQWKNRSGVKTSANKEHWKPISVLERYLGQIDDATIEKIGTEKEGLWAILNVECHEAVVTRCEMPYTCERTLLDPTPRSQYLLTHQLIERMFIDAADCPNLRPFVTDEDTYAKFCTKAYMEAQFLDLLDVPILKRNLFSELVVFCGYLGYTNFFRLDWLGGVLSWQSKSDFGCFVKDPFSDDEAVSNSGNLLIELGFERQPTPKKMVQSVYQTNEKCLPHLTAASMGFVSAYWDYLMDLKGDQRGVE